MRPGWSAHPFGPVATVSDDPCAGATPPLWPERFHITQTKFPKSGGATNSSVETYYDFAAGANLIKDTPHGAAATLWDLELSTGRSYYFTPQTHTCKRLNFSVGILRPDWLQGATSLGYSEVNGIPVCGWTKSDDFIHYYADLHHQLPVRWCFKIMDACFDTVDFPRGFEPGQSIPPNSHWFDPPSWCGDNHN